MNKPVHNGDDNPVLKRELGLGLLVLYGLGVTIGAGIYVLIGVTAGRAGIYAPVSFLTAAFVMVFSAASFAEFSGRFPVSAGEAAYVREGFRSETIALIVGLIVVVGGSIAGATISRGSIGYLQEFIDVPSGILVAGVVVAMGAIAAVGTLQSVGFAAVLTLIEVAGLVAIMVGGFTADPQLIQKLYTVFPQSFTWSVWSGVFGAGLLAFFAFVGFEDMVNVAEETKKPRRTMPLAIFITLGLVTVIYFLISAIAVLSVPVAELAQSAAPLGLVFEAVTPLSPQVISAIAIVATLNGVIIQIIMAARVIYGLADKGNLPKILGRVHPRTRTPIIATALVTGAVMIMAVAFDLEALAEFSSRMTLSIFAIVNLALVWLKLNGRAPKHNHFSVPIWVPAAGFIISVIAIISPF